MIALRSKRFVRATHAAARTLSYRYQCFRRITGDRSSPSEGVVGGISPGETYRIEWLDAYTSSGDRLGLSDWVSNAFVLTGP